jgi:broad specificity phosphatase PhoE
LAETQVHLVRHGHVENPRRVLYGRLPGFNLSAVGRAQAELLARYFAPLPVAAVWSSPLERAQQTAAAIAEAHGLVVETDVRLIEATNLFEGAAGNIAWYVLRHPALWLKLRDPRGPSWGERNVDLAARIQEAVTAAREAAAGRHAVLVSHQAPIYVARLAYERRSLTHWPARRECALGSVTSLSFNGDTLTGVRYSEPAAAPLRAVAGTTPAPEAGRGGPGAGPPG